MAYTLPLCPEGTTIVFGTSAFPNTLRSFDWSGITREALNANTFETAVIGATDFRATVKKPSTFVDYGRIVGETFFDPDVEAMLDKVIETITVTWPNNADVTTPADWEMNGFLVEYNISGTLGGLYIARFTVELSGPITYTVST